MLHAAVRWAEVNPPESSGLEATWPGTDNALPLAGEGAPLVSEFAIAEFAAATGRTTDSGRVLIAHAVELKYRLPRHPTPRRPGRGARWVWRRGRPAASPRPPSASASEAAAFVDTQVAPFAHKISLAQLDRLVAEATARFMPETALEDAQRAAEGRHVTFHHSQVSFTGTTLMEAELDLADALDLDAAITAGAEQLRLAGCTESLDVRRAMAAGDLARTQLALDLAADREEERSADRWSSSERSVETTHRTGSTSPKPRQVVLYVHLSEAAITGTNNCLELGRVENHRRGVTADQIRTWCANPDTQVTVKPVIDLAEHIRVDAYEIPDRLREQTELTDGACVFPWCTRPARRADIDHVIAHAAGGTTCSCNTAPLCRRHHRLKTHSPWTYTVLEPGTYLWPSPHGYQFLRDHEGTLDVTADRRPNRPADPPHS